LTLTLVAGVSLWAAVALQDPGLDPHWSAVGTAMLFAVFFWLLALYKLGRGASLGRPWWKASAWVALGLLALDVIAFVTRLGG
jgi:hypothetical protein